MIAMIFVVLPAWARAPRDRVPIYDVALFALTLGLTAYYVYFAEAILDEAWEYNAPGLAATQGFACAVPK